MKMIGSYYLRKKRQELDRIYTDMERRRQESPELNRLGMSDVVPLEDLIIIQQAEARLAMEYLSRATQKIIAAREMKEHEDEINSEITRIVEAINSGVEGLTGTQQEAIQGIRENLDEALICSLHYVRNCEF